MTNETAEERRQEIWRRTLALFEQALALPPSQRETFLNSAPSDETLVRRTVMEMINSYERAEIENFMEAPAWSYAPPDFNPRALVGLRVGSYRLTRFLDEGGMGVVYLAEPADGFVRRLSAVKLIRADLDPKQYRRFRREAQILADLKHPNLVFLYEAGRMADGRPYLAMEYVEGENLRDWLRGRGEAPLNVIVEVMKQACAGLDDAHAAGVIHRDIKPANIILSESAGKLSVKILDFGVASRKDPEATEISGTYDIIGTLIYMSPEQLRASNHDELTPASDVYSLGLMVYELLTGRPAVTGASPTEIISKHLLEEPLPPGRLRPELDIPAAVDQVIMKALSKEPKARYQRASEFALALGIASVKTEPQSIPTPPTPLPPDPWPNWKKLAAAIAAIAVVAGSLAARLVWRNQAPDSTAQTQPTPMPTATIAPAPQGKLLKIQLEVMTPPGLRYDNCAFALYKSGIEAVPERTRPDNAHVIMYGIGNDSDPRDIKEVNDKSVPPGEYLAKFACAGFKAFSGKVRVAEDRKAPGYATVSVPLGRQ